jgi:hypothetical protein
MFKYSDFELCESDDYENCLHYYFAKNKSRCKYVKKCADYFIENTPEIFKNMFNDEKISSAVKEFTIDYCLSVENSENCETYKRLESGKEPQKFKFPDGKSHFLDILLKRKITIK